MPIESSIALGVKPAQFESPLNQMAQMYQLKNAQSQNELAKYTIDKAQREDEMQNALYARLQDPTFDPTNAAHVKGLYQYGTPGIGVIKSISEQGEKALQQKKITGEIATSDYALKTKQHDETIKDLASTTNPTDAAAAIDRYVTDKKLTADEAAQIKASIPTDSTQYGAWQTKMLTHLTDAKTQLELTKPNFVERTNGSMKWFEDTNSKSPTFGQTHGIQAMQATPGEKLSASTQRRGQDLTNTRELEKIGIEKGKLSPEYIALKAKMEQQGKTQALNEAAMPGVIANATEAIKKIDELVGTAPVVDSKGKVLTAAGKPHAGFGQAVGAGVPGLKYVAGTSAADFNARLEEIQGGAFLEAYNTLKGGGSITEVEGKKATAAITRMSTAQSEAEFTTAARDFQTVLRKGIERAKAKGGSANTNIDALLQKYTD